MTETHFGLPTRLVTNLGLPLLLEILPSMEKASDRTSACTASHATEFLWRLFRQCRDAELKSAGVTLPEALLRMQFHAREHMIANHYRNAERILVFQSNGVPGPKSSEPVAALCLAWRCDMTWGTVRVVDLAVRPDCQCLGIGSTLLRAVQEAARSCGGKVALSVAADNVRARHLYRRLHFREVVQDMTTDDVTHGTTMHVSMQWKDERAG